MKTEIDTIHRPTARPQSVYGWFSCMFTLDGWGYIVDDFGNAIEIDGPLSYQMCTFFVTE